MFERELCALQKLGSFEGIASLYDTESMGEIPFLVTPYERCRDLNEVLRKRKQNKLTPLTAAFMAGSVSSALDYVHEQGVIHRDIKPANVLIGRGIKLIDFGCAITDTHTESENARFCGTVDYGAPESASGKPEDGRTDVYSLGIMLYQALTGVIPLLHDNAQRTLDRHIDEEVPDPRDLDNSIPKELADIVMAATQREMDVRLTARQMAHRLSDFLNCYTPK